MQRKAEKIIDEEDPEVLIASPMCRDFSQMMRINWPKMDPGERARRMRQAVAHLEFVCRLCKKRAQKNKYFLHEHPQQATSWDERCIRDLQRCTQAIRIEMDMCRFGLVTTNDEGKTMYAKKATSLLTNMPAAQVYLAKKGLHDHEHCPLEGSIPGKGLRTTLAQVYPRRFVEASLKSIMLQKQWDAKELFMVGSVDEAYPTSPHHKRMPVPKGEEESISFESAWDDVNGTMLKVEDVRRAREEELKYYRDMKAFEAVPISQAIARTGKKPVDVRWIDHNKGDSLRPQVRCRRVAKDFRTGPDDELYAGTPPLESLKLILSHAVTGSKTRCIMTNDVSRAYLHSPCRSEVYARRAEEDMKHKHGDNNIDGEAAGGTCWRLLKSMYGTRPAARDWQQIVAEALGAVGFIPGKACPNTYHHPGRQLWTFIHGDDFCGAGEVSYLEWLRARLEEQFLIKTQVLGPHHGQARQVRMLNRLLAWHVGVGLCLEADPRHIDKVIRELGVDNQKPLAALRGASARLWLSTLPAENLTLRAVVTHVFGALDPGLDLVCVTNPFERHSSGLL